MSLGHLYPSQQLGLQYDTKQADLTLLSYHQGVAFFQIWLEGADDANHRPSLSRILIDLAERTILLSASLMGESANTLQVIHGRADVYALDNIRSVVIRASLVLDREIDPVWRSQCFRGEKKDDCAASSLLCEVSQRFIRVPTSNTMATSSKAASANEATAVRRESALAPQDERREGLFAAARNVFVEKGFGSTTVREIAIAANLPATSMYQYVSSKEDLLYEIILSYMSQLLSHLRGKKYDDADAFVNLRDAIDAYMRFAENNRRIITLLHRETRSLSVARQREVMAMERAVIGIWADIIAIGQSDGQFAAQDPFLAANAVYALCTMWALRWWAVGRFGRDEITTVVTKFARGGVGIA